MPTPRALRCRSRAAVKDEPVASMSWASIAQQPAAPQFKDLINDPVPSGTVAVLDASGIISGFSRQVADNLTTIPEVLDECKDAVAKQRLQMLPEGIKIQQPSAESLKRVTQFAKAVGEHTALSRVDLRLLALTYTLESAAHGELHLRQSPPPPRVAAKRHSGKLQLPGWDESGGNWADMDALNEAEAAQPAESDVSRISSSVQFLHLDDIPAPSIAGQSVGNTHDDSSSEGDDEAAHQGSEDEWAVAAKSNNAARQRKRRQLRKAARDAYVQGAESTGRESVADAHEQHASAEQPCSRQLEPNEDADSDSDGSDSHASTSTAVSGQEAEADTQDSSVALVTGDYAMQNVCLQMGMRLVAPDGSRVTRVARWALRCCACFKVTLESGRLFCGQCGNAALDKVEVVVGADGLQQYGVRKTHNLRGTRYTLPKPKGGKNKQPILREDVLLQRMSRTKKKQSDTPDAFAPEYGQDTWFAKHNSGSTARGDQVAAAASLGASKRNPNERWQSRTNRRK